MNEFPKQVFVVIDPAPTPDDEETLLAHVDPGVLSLTDNSRPAARYILAGAGTLTNKTLYTETHEEE